MESFVSVSTLLNLVLTVIWFISGIRDFQGKDPFLDLPFNQYHRDPEYRAFWQKKNGVFYMLNSIALWETFFILSLTKAGTIVRIDSRKGATMNLNLSDWDWLNAALGVLFLYRGIRDLYNGTGTGWSSEDEKKHFRKFYGIASILCGALYLVNTFLPRVEPLNSILMVAALVLCAALLISYLCYTLSRDDKTKK